MVSSEYWFGAEAGFYNSVATQSLRFDGTRATTLYRDIAQAGNRKIATYAFWLKFDATDTSFTVFSKGDGGGVQTSFDISIDSSRLRARFFESDSQTGLIRTNRLLRDSSAWYHIVVAIDVSQGTSSDRVKLYINGTQETSLESSSYPSDSNTVIGNNSAHTRERIGDSQMSYFPNTATGGSSSNRLNGYLCDFHHVDGQQLTPSSFGEFKNGTWIAIDYTGNHGDNGFRLEFKQTGDGQSTASSSTIGADTGVDGSGSATNNHFKDQNFEATDSNMPDSPENNFATLNTLDKGSQVDLSEGILGISWSNNSGHAVRSTFTVSSGKWYMEFLKGTSSVTIGIAKQNNNGVSASSGWIGSSAYGSGGSYSYSSDANKYTNGSNTSYGASYGSGDVIGVAFDADNGTITFYKNGSSQGQAYSSISGEFAFGIGYFGGSTGGTVAGANFGQDSTFSNTISQGGNSDENGIGDFKYSVPSGYLALCSANLPEPSIGANSDTQADDHFNTVLYTGNGGTQSITGVGFQPDWTWLKRRNGATSHRLMDSSRGDTKYLSSNTTNAEDITQGVFASFDTDGFSLNGTANAFNGNGNTYVGWNWKANGTTPTKTYKVVVVSDSGNKYRFRNSADSATFAQSAVTLDLQEGGTYTFDWSDSSAQGHPIRFSLTADGTHGGGSEYTTGVVKDDSAYTTTITVASGVATLYYYCQNHSGMGGQINTNTTFGSTNFDGSALTITNANTTSGFSIVLYTGTGSTDTFGHGLGAVPKWFFTKTRSTTGDWIVYHGENTSAPETDFLKLNETNATEDLNTMYNDTAPTSTVFTLSTNGDVNTNGRTQVGYCFAEVEGYSKFGSYTGNGSTDGTFVFTGFRPAWVLIKRTDTGGHDWMLVDSTRDTINPVDNTLFPSGSTQELDGDDKDFLSNGFKHRSTGASENASGGTYIYMAFAEAPFKYANGR